QVQALLGDKPLLELEPPESLATTLQTLEPAEQLPVMQRLLREQGQDALRALTAWQQGDLESLGQNLDQVALPAAARQTLFDQRQQRWAEEIARAMKSGEPLFIAVAAGHLSGAQGLPQRLASLGIQVERWRY
ncbi:MAG: TraB/GumN family protein, partial [Inhella sp.]